MRRKRIKPVVSVAAVAAVIVGERKLRTKMREAGISSP